MCVSVEVRAKCARTFLGVRGHAAIMLMPFDLLRVLVCLVLWRIRHRLCPLELCYMYGIWAQSRSPRPCVLC